MTLLDWRRKGRSLEEDIRLILQRAGKKDTSPQACKMWARVFISTVVEDWTPGKELTPVQARAVGAQFERLLLRAGVPRTKVQIAPRRRSGFDR